MKPTRNLLPLLALGLAAAGCAELEAYANRTPDTDAVERDLGTRGTERDTSSDVGPGERLMSGSGNGEETAETGEPEAVAFRADELIRQTQALPTGDPATSALLLEKVTPREVMRGVEFEYLLRVENLTEMLLEGVVVEDELSGNMRLVSSEPEANLGDGGVARWALGNLAAGESVDIRIRGVAGEGEWVDTLAQAEYRSALRSRIAVVAPSLEVDLSVPELATPGSEIPLSITVTNSGSGFARDVMVSADLPAGVETLDGDARVSEEVGDLGTGESKTIEVSVRAANTGSFTAAAEATMRRGPKVQSTARTVAVMQAQLSLEVNGPDTAFLGRPSRWTLTVKNGGKIVANGVTLQSAIPDGLKFVRAEPAAEKDGDRLSWALGTFEPGEEESVTVHLQPESAGAVTVAASVAGDKVPSVSASDDTSMEGRAALSLELVDLTDPVLVGDSMTYHVKVFNQGTASDHEVQVAVVLDEGMELIRAGGETNGKRASQEDPRIAFVPLGELKAGATATWRIVIRSTRPGDLRLRASLQSKTIQEPVEETESTIFYE